jgi:hypothetical protein
MKKYIVLNVTDGITASPEEFTKAQAERFVKNFPKRFKIQGYYRNNRMEKMNPNDVVLKVIPSGENIIEHLQ